MWFLLLLPIAFLLVLWNNRNNQRKLYRRKKRNFKENYQAKKEGISQKNIN
ncbi:Uncharacterised protein [Capnocytophaga canimorsus]|nr:hypothetical protein CLV61_1223 [Capnocytophaga canimorsus]STA71275.1 Uncharacterised protein [Capnocytophaga canimorsus]VEJ18157.1 Uncharacterised protein [Capnocytophaga canimorsus]